MEIIMQAFISNYLHWNTLADEKCNDLGLLLDGNGDRNRVIYVFTLNYSKNYALRPYFIWLVFVTTIVLSTVIINNKIIGSDILWRFL